MKRFKVFVVRRWKHNNETHAKYYQIGRMNPTRDREGFVLELWALPASGQDVVAFLDDGQKPRKDGV